MHEQIREPKTILTVQHKNRSTFVLRKEGKVMASKVWKRVLFIVLIIACLFNITAKLVRRNSFKSELQSSAQYIQDIQENNQNEIEE